MNQKVKFILSKADNSTKNNDYFFSEENRCYSFLNPYGYNLMRKNTDLFAKVDGYFFDGVLLCIFYKLFYKVKVKRKSFDMTSMAKSLFEFLSIRTNETIYFIGAKQSEIDKAIANFRKDYPKMNIVSYRNGYFTDEAERSSVIKGIIELNPSFVIVGMGAMIQEEFVIDLKEMGYKGISFTCGGFFHQASGNLFFFPKWIDKLHLRSFYRLYKEKSTRARFSRIIFNFPFNFLKDRFL